jgi:hypothetical protein
MRAQWALQLAGLPFTSVHYLPLAHVMGIKRLQVRMRGGSSKSGSSSFLTLPTSAALHAVLHVLVIKALQVRGSTMADTASLHCCACSSLRMSTVQVSAKVCAAAATAAAVCSPCPNLLHYMLQAVAACKG